LSTQFFCQRASSATEAATENEIWHKGSLGCRWCPNVEYTQRSARRESARYHTRRWKI